MKAVSVANIKYKVKIWEIEKQIRIAEVEINKK